MAPSPLWEDPGHILQFSSYHHSPPQSLSTVSSTSLRHRSLTVPVTSTLGQAPTPLSESLICFLSKTQISGQLRGGLNPQHTHKVDPSSLTQFSFSPSHLFPTISNLNGMILWHPKASMHSVPPKAVPRSSVSNSFSFSVFGTAFPPP